MGNYIRSLEKFHCIQNVSTCNRAIAGRERYRHRGFYGGDADGNDSLSAGLNGHSCSIATMVDGTFPVKKWRIGPSAQVNFDTIYQHVHSKQLNDTQEGGSYCYRLLQGCFGFHASVHARKICLSVALDLCRDCPCGNYGKVFVDFRGYDFQCDRPVAVKRNSSSGEICLEVPIRNSWRMTFRYRTCGHGASHDHALAFSGVHCF
jgi:hypothetical protein